jgi:hypothetical protein
MTATISLQDREAIHDTLKRYLWCMDTSNIDGVVDTFTPDATIKDVTGKRWDAAAGGARGFATHFLTLPNRPDSQHWVQHMFIESASNDAWRVVSYWSSLAWTANSDEKFIRLLGSYRDTCVNVQGRWLIAEKIIDPWNGTSVPTGGVFAP